MVAGFVALGTAIPAALISRRRCALQPEEPPKAPKQPLAWILSAARYCAPVGGGGFPGSPPPKPVARCCYFATRRVKITARCCVQGCRYHYTTYLFCAPAIPPLAQPPSTRLSASLLPACWPPHLSALLFGSPGIASRCQVEPIPTPRRYGNPSILRNLQHDFGQLRPFLADILALHRPRKRCVYALLHVVARPVGCCDGCNLI